MSKRFLGSAAALALAIGMAAPAAANSLYFQMNPNLLSGPRQVFLFGQPGVTGTVTGPGGFLADFTLGTDGFAIVSLNLADQLTSGVVENKGFRVDSSSAISGYFLNRAPATTDMTYLIDGSRLGTDHVVASYGSSSQMSAQATQDGTTVTMTAANGTVLFNATLNAGETYMVQSGDLTGSRITSDKPIAVFSGNQCTNIIRGACDHIVEQIPSVDKLSSSYLMGQTPRTGTLGNPYRAIATQDGTEIRQNGTLVATLDAGQFHEGLVVGGVEVTGSKPFMMAKYLPGQGEGFETDPAMTIVPGSDQWLSSYVFAAPSGEADFEADFVSIVIRTSDISTLRLNGTAPDTSGFATLGSTLFSYGNIDVSLNVGAFSISAASPFQLLLSGFDFFDSYFTYGGAAFSPGASPPGDEQRVHWDGLGPADDGIVQGGDGTWTTTSTNFTFSDGATNGAQDPQPSTVVFGGTGGTVTVSNVDGDVSVTGMTFNVDGYVITGDAVTLAGGTAAFTVTAGNTATIQSRLTGEAGLSMAGGGLLHLASANDFTGDLTVNLGTVRGGLTSFGTGLVTVNDKLIIDATSNDVPVFRNLLAGGGTIYKQGNGLLWIKGENSFSGELQVLAGTLRVDPGEVMNGSTVTDGGISEQTQEIAFNGLGAALVRLGGTMDNGDGNMEENNGVSAPPLLIGTGSVGGFVAMAGSTVSPGPGIATLTVTGLNGTPAGNAVFESGSTYQVEVTSTGQSDRIVVTGTANIATGTTLSFTKTDAPRFVLGTRYTVLSTDGGRTGSFATLSGPTRVSRFISVVQETDVNNVYLAVRQTSSFASAARTPNQIAAATGADSAGNGTLYTAIAYLDTDAQAQAAFDQVSGELHPSVRGATVQDTRFVREALSSHMQALDDTRKGLWMSAYGSWGTTDSDGNAAEMKRDIGGFFLGFDALRGDNYAIGVLGGYGRATINVVDRGGGRATSDDIHIGAYAGFRSGKFIANVSLTHMWRNLDTRRTVTMAGFTDTLTASYQTEVTQFFGEAALSLPAGKLALEPFVQLAYADVTTDPIAEVGGAARLTAARVSDGYLISTLGGRIKYGLPVGDGKFGITAEAGWRHFGGGRETTPIIFNLQAGPAFAVQGVPIGRDVAALGLIVSGQIGKGIEVDFGYRGHVGNGVKDHGVRGGIVVRF